MCQCLSTITIDIQSRSSNLHPASVSVRPGGLAASRCPRGAAACFLASRRPRGALRFLAAAASVGGRPRVGRAGVLMACSRRAGVLASGGHGWHAHGGRARQAGGRRRRARLASSRAGVLAAYIGECAAQERVNALRAW